MSHRKEPHYSSVETNELPDKVESAHLCPPHVETVLSGQAFALQAQDPEFHPQLSSWKRMYCVCIYIYMHHNLQKTEAAKKYIATTNCLWSTHIAYTLEHSSVPKSFHANALLSQKCRDSLQD